MAVEEAPYTVTFTQGQFQLRDYPALVAAEVTVSGDRRTAASQGFRLLAGYIFGGNARKQSIAMTAPVTQAPGASEKIAMTAPVVQTGGNGEWTIRFIMPRGSVLESMPTPNDSRVHLRGIAPVRMAVVRFSGVARSPAVDEQTRALQKFMAAQYWQAIGPASLAQFDPPWTLWFLRKNEIMIPVAK